MDKNVKLKLIGQASWLLPEFEPISQSSNPLMFLTLLDKFEKFEDWDETEKISKEEFETLLNRNDDLVDAYLDVYTVGANFYRCTVCFEQRVFEHNLMLVNKKIVLLFIQGHAVFKIN